MIDKPPLLYTMRLLSDAYKKASDLGFFTVLVTHYLFLKNYTTSDGAVSHNVLYCQKLSIACNQCFYANNYFE